MMPTLKRVTRLDSIPVNQALYTEEGYLKDRPVLTSTGIFEYSNPDGSIRRELRLPEDVFAPESLASYEGKPIIITHDAGLVTKDNVHEYQVGTILSEGYKSGHDVKAKIIIHDTGEMKKSGLKELSLGYNLDLEETPGEWNGQRYDAIQRNIRINHLALVREARAGEQARLNIDSKDGNTLVGGKLMKKTFRKALRRDEALSPEELQKAIEWYKANRDKIANQDADEPEEEEGRFEKEIAPIREQHSEEPVAPVKEEPVEEEEVTVEEEKKQDADEVIRDQDKDIRTLLDIIDTLLAEKAFDEAEPETEKKPEEEEEFVEEEENFDEDDDVEIVEAEELIPEDEASATNIIPEDEATKENHDSEDEEEEEELMKYEEKALMNTDSIDRIVRERVKIGMVGKKLNLDGLEGMKILKAKKTIIKAVRPSVRLDGKSLAYINAMYDMAVQDVEKRTKKGTDYQRRQMFNKDAATVKKDVNSPENARERMIERHQNKKGENK
ncbi:MAG: DUF2213 domain-containing protein [Lachnospiraceae bacterium]|nr:DUF2213 domain-containing protein [Lachnospiraceae bacterium]